MKRYTIILLFVLSAFLSVGCKRFLDVKPQGKVIPQTESEYAAVLNYRLNNIEAGAYDYAVGTASNISMYEGFADDFNANLAVGNLPIYAGTDFNKHQDIYRDLYAVIKDCNIIIEAMDAKDSDEARMLSAACKGLKGVSYYQLMRNYCKAYKKASAENELGLCIVDAFDIEYYPERSDLRTTADYVVKTLKSSIAYGISDPKYMFTADVVKAYLAKTYFWIQNWSECLALCEELVKIYPLEECADYIAAVNSEYEKTSSVIIRSHINDNNTSSASIRSQAIADLRSRPLSASLVKLFDAKDVRLENVSGKWKCLKEPSVKLRSAELYLMIAECQAHLGRSSDALETLNFVRSKRVEGWGGWTEATLPEVDAAQRIKVDAEGKPLTRLMSAILNERRMELFGEGDRWFELKRNGMPTWRIINDATGIYQKYTMEEYMYTFPINKDDTELKDYIKQNEGYVEYSSK